MTPLELIAYGHLILFSIAVTELLRSGDREEGRRKVMLCLLAVLCVSWLLFARAAAGVCRLYSDSWAMHVNLVYAGVAGAALGYGSASSLAGAAWFYLIRRNKRRAAAALITAIALLMLLDFVRQLRLD